MNKLNNQPTLLTLLWAVNHKSPAARWLRNIVLVFCGSILLTISAKIQIPFFPVPITMQTLVVLLIGFSYGSRLGAATVMLYLLEGLGGIPVFADTPAKGLGWSYMVGPTGGYLLGFLFAAILCGMLAERAWDRSIVRTTCAMFLANLVIYIPGLIWLGNVVGWDKPILQWGLFPFLLGDVLKIAIAVIMLPTTWKIINKKINHKKRNAL